MKQLTKSDNYVISYEYEKVFLLLKQTGKTILIGEFYGDPHIAIISKNEDFCVIGGEGAIIYYLHEPFQEFNEDVQSKQWKEWGRNGTDQPVWIEKIEQIDEGTIKLTLEDHEEMILTI